MAEFNTQVIMTKILLRNDVLENWQVSSIVLEKGEPAIEFNPNTLRSKIKIGDGIHTFMQLPYSTMTPDEIKAMIDASSNGGSSSGGSIDSVILGSGTEDGTLKIVINGVSFDNIAVTGLGSAAYTDASDYATAEQGARANIAMLFIGVISELPTVNVNIGNTYSVSSELTIPSDKSSTHEDVNVVPGAVITVGMDGLWDVVTPGASVVNTDYLIQGDKTIIFMGGNAAD